MEKYSTLLFQMSPNCESLCSSHSSPTSRILTKATSCFTISAGAWFTYQWRNWGWPRLWLTSRNNLGKSSWKFLRVSSLPSWPMSTSSCWAPSAWGKWTSLWDGDCAHCLCAPSQGPTWTRSLLALGPFHRRGPGGTCVLWPGMRSDSCMRAWPVLNPGLRAGALDSYRKELVWESPWQRGLTEIRDRKKPISQFPCQR